MRSQSHPSSTRLIVNWRHTSIREHVQVADGSNLAASSISRKGGIKEPRACATFGQGRGVGKLSSH